MRLLPAGYRWRVSPVLTVAFLVLLALLSSLGFWQLQRAEEKQRYFAQREAHRQEAPIDLHLILTDEGAIDWENWRDQRVVVEGYFDGAHQFLLDNQIHRGRAGYHVLTPFKIRDSGHAVLINRGWIAAPADRTLLPDIAVPGEAFRLVGRWRPFFSVGLLLPGADEPSAGWPARVAVAQSETMSRVLGYAVADGQVLLDADMPAGYLRAWEDENILPPATHIAYAVQWFGLALTLCVLVLLLGLKKTPHA